MGNVTVRIQINREIIFINLNGIREENFSNEMVTDVLTMERIVEISIEQVENVKIVGHDVGNIVTDKNPNRILGIQDFKMVEMVDLGNLNHIDNFVVLTTMEKLKEVGLVVVVDIVVDVKIEVVEIIGNVIDDENGETDTDYLLVDLENGKPDV